MSAVPITACSPRPHGDSRVLLRGFSLGSLVTCEFGAHTSSHQLAALFLEPPNRDCNAFAEVVSLLNLPGSRVTTYVGNDAQRIWAVRTALLWVHGALDETLNRETRGAPIWDNHHVGGLGGAGWVRTTDARALRRSRGSRAFSRSRRSLTYHCDFHRTWTA